MWYRSNISGFFIQNNIVCECFILIKRQVYSLDLNKNLIRCDALEDALSLHDVLYATKRRGCSYKVGGFELVKSRSYILF